MYSLCWLFCKNNCCCCCCGYGPRASQPDFNLLATANPRQCGGTRRHRPEVSDTMARALLMNPFFVERKSVRKEKKMLNRKEVGGTSRSRMST